MNIKATDAMRMSALADLDTVAYRLAAGGGDLKFLPGAHYVRHWLNDRGAQWRTNVQVGYENLLTTSLYQPFDVAQRIFVETELFASRSVEDLHFDRVDRGRVPGQ